MIDNRPTPRERPGRALLLALVVCAGGTLAAGDGRATVELRGVSGGVVRPLVATAAAAVAFFVATDCPVSNSYAPEIQRVCREYGPRGVGCSLVYEDVDTPRSSTPLERQVRTHLAEYGYVAMPAAIDRDRRAATAAKATITPQAVVVDRAGTIRYRGRIDNLYAALGKRRQQVTSHDLRDALDAVLAGRKVESPETEALGCYITDPLSLKAHDHE